MGDDSSTVFEVFKGGSVVFVGLIAELAISFVAKVVIARFLGREIYGGVSLGITMMSVVSVFTLLGLNSGVARYLPRYDTPERRRGVILSAFQIVVPLSIALSIVIFVSAEWIATVLFGDPGITAILRVFALIIPLTSVVRLTISSVQGMKHTVPKVYIKNLSLPICRFAGVGVAIYLGLYGLGVAGAYAFSYAVATTLSVWYLYRSTPLFDRDVVPVGVHRELLTFSLPLLVSAASWLIFSDLDTFMLGYFSQTGDVGVYNTVYPLAELLTIALGSLGFVATPVFSELHAGEEFGLFSHVYEILTKWVYLATFPVLTVFVLFPRTVIQITFGAEYAVGAASLVVLSTAFFSHAVAGPNSNALTAIGKTRLIMYDNAAVAAVNFALNIVLIPRYSVLGAAAATAVAYVLLNVLYSYQLYQVTGIVPVSRSLLLAAATGGILGLGLNVLSVVLIGTGAVRLLLFVALFAPTYTLIAVRFGVTADEIELFLEIEDRLDMDLTPIRILGRYLVD